jgi:hypothetical protein
MRMATGSSRQSEASGTPTRGEQIGNIGVPRRGGGRPIRRHLRIRARVPVDAAATMTTC